LPDASSDLMNGTAGFLYALLLLDKRLSTIQDDSMEIFIKEIKYFINEAVKKLQNALVKKRTKPLHETTFLKQSQQVQIVSITKRRRKTEQFI
jgi:hypothetical protein